MYSSPARPEVSYPRTREEGGNVRKLGGRKIAAVVLIVLMISTVLVIALPAAAGACGYTSWYLPEGYTGGNFDTFVLIQNPNDCIAKVKVRFLTDTSVTEPITYSIPETSRFTIKVDEIPGLSNANVSTIVEQLEGSGIVVERAMYFSYEGGKAGGSNSIGANQTSTAWYLAEGYTGGNFNTYILVMNPNDRQARVKARFITPPVVGAGGQTEPNWVEKEYTIEAMRRLTIHVDEIPGLENTDVSTQIYSLATGAGGETTAAPVVAERAMYFDYFGLDGGHCSIGAPCKSNTWYLPEGRTAGEYDTYVLVMNPNSTRTHVKATFLVPVGGAGGGREFNPTPPTTDPPPAPVPNQVVTKEYVLEPYERYTIALDKVPGLEATDVATVIESWTEPVAGAGPAFGGENQVVAERAMYFTRGNDGDGHNTIGASQKRDYWLLAEGYTTGKFDTWVLLMNPNEDPVKVKIEFMKTDASDPIVKEYEVLGMSRMTIPVDLIPGLESTEVSAKIYATAWSGAGRRADCEFGIIAERAMYFEYNGIVGGHCSLGVGEY